MGLPIAHPSIVDATQQFEALFSRVEMTTIYSPDIVEVACGCVKEEGGLTPVWCIDEATAAFMWFEGAKRYKATQQGDVLVWRVKPEVTGHRFFTIGYASHPDGSIDPVTLFKSYSRFAVRQMPADYMAAVRDSAKAQ